MKIRQITEEKMPVLSKMIQLSDQISKVESIIKTKNEVTDELWNHYLSLLDQIQVESKKLDETE